MKTVSKTQYTISQFAALVNLTPDTLRYYESLGLLKPKRDQAQRRYYEKQDIAWIDFLRHLKGTGMTMTELQKYVRLRAQGDQIIKERISLLQKVEAKGQLKIKQLNQNLRIVQHKLDWYQAKLQGKIAEYEDFGSYLAKFKE